MPTILQAHGLKTALSDVCKQIADGIDLMFNLTGLPQQLEEYLKLAIYRIVQELLVNIVRHANATRASLSVKAENQSIYILIEDNGRGFTNTTKRKMGIGLPSIKNKVNLLKGTIQIISNASGTKVDIRLPLTGVSEDTSNRDSS